MDLLALFQRLKSDVLLTYKKQHPYFEGDWKTFSSQDILNLIDRIEEKVKQRVSEKWIYTHLKPEDNLKLPRKDMLDILSQFVGYAGWDEYVFKHKTTGVDVKTKSRKDKWRLYRWILPGILLMVSIGFYIYPFPNVDPSKTITIKDAFTNEKIDSGAVQAVVVADATETPVDIVDSEIKLSKDNSKVRLKSPFYKDKTVVITTESPSDISLEPDDYAMMLKAFMKSDIKDWQTRKVQLQKILADDAAIIVILQDNLGFEYFNKAEFSEKLIVPSASLKKMRLIDIKYNHQNEINFVRIIQD